MRLKIKVVGGLFGNAGKYWPGNLPPIIQFRCACVRIIEYDKSDKLRMIGW
jgi:hypothetical protein